jgi:hypothetical protein
MHKWKPKGVKVKYREAQTLKPLVPNYIQHIRTKYRCCEEPASIYIPIPPIDHNINTKSMIEILENASKSECLLRKPSIKLGLISNLLQMGRESAKKNKIEKYSIRKGSVDSNIRLAHAKNKFKKEIKSTMNGRLGNIEGDYKVNLIQEMEAKAKLKNIFSSTLTKTHFTPKVRKPYQGRTSCVLTKLTKGRDLAQDEIRGFMSSHHRNTMSKKVRFKCENIKEDFDFYLRLINSRRLSSPKKFLREQVIFRNNKGFFTSRANSNYESNANDYVLTSQKLDEVVI